ncbi:hypothetical protein QOZ80_4BG0336680 [Eleusine coracana subsp. coracana]|nr:hypothetical protein QOZ80_4BG0336680 [Eleusine coracana subsp. coracana]
MMRQEQASAITSSTTSLPVCLPARRSRPWCSRSTTTLGSAAPSSDFRRLHFRLSPPLAHPHIAYISKFHGFHVAGAGHNSDAPIRMMGRGMFYTEMKYVNTCNGVLLFVHEHETERPTCVLWNPAVAESEKELTVPSDERGADNFDILLGTCSNDPGPGDYSILGFGYGKRSKSYKLLLSFRQKQARVLKSRPPKPTYSKELLVYTLEILAFDIDKEKVETIRMPGTMMHPKLMQIYGRLCLVTDNDGCRRALWLLTADRQWEQKCVFTVEDDLKFCPIKGVWDYNGVIVLFLYNEQDDSKLFLYEVATEKMLIENLSYDLTPRGSHYSFSWGYKPTLLSPESIVNELNQDVNWLGIRKDNIVKAKRPFHKEDKRKIPKAALSTIRFMEYLVRVMEKLPGKMSLLNLEDSEGHSQDPV